MFHNDKDGYIRGCRFDSDVWHHNTGAKVVTDDLGDTEKYGSNITLTWSLFGIIEGGAAAGRKLGHMES